MIRQFELLKERRFLPLFVTQFLGALNDNFLRGVLTTLIIYAGTTLMHYSSVLSITVAGVFILPFFLFSAVSGQIADKFEMAKLIRIAKIAEIIIMAVAAYGVYTHNIVLLIFLMFLKGVQATFFGPLKYAILPKHLAEYELIAANGLIDGSTFLAILLGTILGTVLIFIPWGIEIISCLFLVFAVGGLCSSLYIPPAKISDPQLKINLNFPQEIYKIIKYTQRHKRIFLSILAISWFWFFGMSFTSEFPAYTRVVIHGQPNIMTLFLTVFTVGIAVGSLLCNKILRGKINSTFVPISVFLMSLFTLDLYHASVYFLQLSHTGPLISFINFMGYLQAWRILIDLFLISMMAGLFVVPLLAILQHEGESSHLSRIIASNNIFNSFFMVASAGMSACLLSLNFSVAQIFYFLGVLNIFVAVYICKLLPDALPRSIVHTLCKLLYRVEIIGLENYYAAGKRVVIIANHTSYLDAALLAAFLPDRLTFAINTQVSLVWWVRPFLWLVDAFPINQTKPMAIKSLIEYVRKNKRVIIFPEGRVTLTGALMKIYEGPGMVADKARAKLLPIRIEGAEYTFFSKLSGKVPTKWFPKITLTILPPQNFELDDILVGRKRRQVISAKLYDLMKEMMLTSSAYQKPLFYSLLEAAEIYGFRHIIAEDIRREPIKYHKLLIGSFILGKEAANISVLGEYMGILLPNAIATAVLFFGLQAYGRVPAMLNFSSGAKNILAACKVANITKVYTSKEFIEKAKLQTVILVLEKNNIKIIYLELLRDKINILKKIRGFLIGCIPKLYYKKLFKIKTDQDLMRLSHKPAAVLFTSGSEGTPKGVVLSHANIQANRFQISASIDFGQHDNLFNALPVFHSFGLTGGMILPFLLGTKVFFYPTPLHFRIIPELVYDTSSSILFGTDTFLAKYAQFAHPYDFYSLRYVFAGAEKLRDETKVLWSEKFGLRILEGYGTTEAAPILSLNTPMLYKRNTVGKLLPGILYKLEPVEGVQDGGRLWVSGPNIMLGYLLENHPGKLIAPPDGWYDTGDIVSIDSDGFISIKGRAKRFAKIGGEMISLTAVEEELLKLWPGYLHAVLNIEDAKKGEQLILITNYPDADRKLIIEFFRKEGLSELSIPKKIKIIQSMPLLGSGKIDYMGLREIL